MALPTEESLPSNGGLTPTVVVEGFGTDAMAKTMVRVENLHVGLLSRRRNDCDRFGKALALPLFEPGSQVCGHVLISFLLVDDRGHHRLNLHLRLGTGER